MIKLYSYRTGKPGDRTFSESQFQALESKLKKLVKNYNINPIIVIRYGDVLPDEN